MRPSRLYPVSLCVEGRACLVVGGGAVALRKARGLVAAGARVRVVSPDIAARPSRVAWTRRRFRASDVRGMALVFAATDDPRVNLAVAAACGRHRIPVNVADAPERCDFQVPSVVRKGRLTLAISTGGASPALARAIKQRVAGLLRAGFDRLADEIGRLRRRALARIPDAAARRRLLTRLASEQVVARLERGGIAEARKALHRLWREATR